MNYYFLYISYFIFLFPNFFHNIPALFYVSFDTRYIYLNHSFFIYLILLYLRFYNYSIFHLCKFLNILLLLFYYYYYYLCKLKHFLYIFSCSKQIFKMNKLKINSIFLAFEEKHVVLVKFSILCIFFSFILFKCLIYLHILIWVYRK